jgi:hypothetical protein
MNIEQLDDKGRRVCGRRFSSEGRVVAGDVMLAQKIALETNEKAALKWRTGSRLGLGRLT